ncbi:MAG TPA: SUF system NifU family Fe-S cluster assembly protein [Gemmatimonadaceae bacterium]|nr:SUF system NifU family Fe-S cluster assembly protein [Gemmatimonadaceae bacterium]
MPSPDDALTAVYRDLLLDHFRRPRNSGALEHPDVAVHQRNPLCGDEIELQLAFDGDVLRDVRFRGQGCTISQASASMMTQRLQGKSVAEIEEVARRFTAMLHGDREAAVDPALGDLRSLAGVARLPVRLRCALLAWSALAQGLSERPVDQKPE